MLYESKYEIGQFVYLRTDKDQQERLVTGIIFRPNGVQYDLSPGASWYYELEISEEKNVLATTTN